MPYEWLPSPTGETRLHLWPYRSLPRKGFVWFIGGTSALISLPLLTLIGKAAFWGILPFLILTVGGVWLALNRSYRDGEMLEVLSLWPDRIELVRHNPHGPKQEWVANPYWVTVQLYETRGPVLNYLTLKGAGREVELGAFLAPDERLTLRDQVRTALADLG